MEIKEIINYIKEALDLGISEEKIKDNLLKENIEEKQIEELIVTIKKEAKEKSNKLYLGIIPQKLPSLILFNIGFGGLFLAICCYNIAQTTGDNLVEFVYSMVFGELIVLSIIIFLLSFLLKNLDFRDFFKKETYSKNAVKIIINIILFFNLYFFSYQPFLVLLINCFLFLYLTDKGFKKKEDKYYFITAFLFLIYIIIYLINFF